MKTTVERPDELMWKAKSAAVRRRITLKDLFTRALEKELRTPSAPKEDDRFTIDEDGWPVFNRKDYAGTPVTNELVRQLREQEGI